MLKECAKLLAIASVIFSLGFGNGDAMANSDSELPIRSITFTVPPGAQGQFFDQLREYAETYAFAIRIAASRPDIPSFLIQMWREDIKMIGTNAVNLDKFRLGFYQNGREPVPTEIVDQTVSRLRRALTEFHGVIVSEEK